MKPNKDYFFCYSQAVSDFLFKKSIQFITVAVDKNTGKEFALYEVTPELNKALDDRKKNIKYHMNKSKHK